MAPSKPEKLVDAANVLSQNEFVQRFVLSSFPQLSYRVPSTEQNYKIAVTKAITMSPEDFDACFNLIKYTSGAAYKNSTDGWHPKKKKDEMRDPNMYYLLVRAQADETCVGFASLMVTIEDEYPAVYLYEIHLSDSLRGLGVGAYLMQIMETIGKNADMERAMLTVFSSNESAERFYRKRGYETYYTPEPRILRGGKVQKPEYAILSKSLR